MSICGAEPRGGGNRHAQQSHDHTAQRRRSARSSLTRIRKPMSVAMEQCSTVGVNVVQRDDLRAPQAAAAAVAVSKEPGCASGAHRHHLELLQSVRVLRVGDVLDMRVDFQRVDSFPRRCHCHHDARSTRSESRYTTTTKTCSRLLTESQGLSIGLQPRDRRLLLFIVLFRRPLPPLVQLGCGVHYGGRVDERHACRKTQACARHRAEREKE